MSVSADDVAVLQKLASEGKLPIRVDNFMVPEDSAAVLASGPSQDATGLVRVRGIKLYADGALGSRGAALLEPYNDAEGTGLLVMSHEFMLPLLRKALQAHAQVTTHAIGDRGNRLTLDGYEQVFREQGAAAQGVRWRIEHAQILSPADVPRFAQLGVIASMQPSHAISDLYFAPRAWAKSVCRAPMRGTVCSTAVRSSPPAAMPLLKRAIRSSSSMPLPIVTT